MKLSVYQKYRFQKVLKRIFSLITVAAILVLFRTYGCQSDDTKKLQRGMETTDGTGQEITNAIFSAYDDTVKIWTLTTEKMIQDEEAKQIHLAPVDLNMFNDSGVITTQVESDSGLTTQKMDNFYIWGNVVITDEDGNTMKSRSLNWDKKKRLLYSSDYVEIATKSGEVLRGKGFEASEDFSWWEFKKEVSGKFNNFDTEFEDDKNEDEE